MAYQVYYPSGCAADVPDHYCNPCDTPEHGRVRAVAFIANTFAFTDPTSPSQWAAGIAAKQIIIVPQVNGVFDGGTPVEATGYGDQATKITGYNFVATYNDPNYKFNADFYNAIKNSSNWRFAYKTETQIHLTETTVNVKPKNPVVDDVASEVVWNVDVSWADGDLPIPYDQPPGIFVCFDYTGVIT